MQAESTFTRSSPSIEDPISTQNARSLSKGRKNFSTEEGKTKGVQGPDFTHHVIGAVLNILSALAAAGYVTALQLVSVNMVH